MKFAPAPPPGLRNGLMIEAALDRIIHHPQQPFLVVAMVDTASITTDFRKGGARTAAVGFLAIEPMLEVGNHATARRLLEQAYIARTSEQLELDIFDETLLARGGSVLRDGAGFFGGAE